MANYCVMHDAKHKVNSTKMIQAEAERKLEKYKNAVNPDRSQDNLVLVETDDWDETVREMLSEKDITYNDKSVTVITSIYSASPDFFQGKSDEEINDYFSDCLEYHRKHRGGEVISAIVHRDETTPHMHVATVPLFDAIPVYEYYARLDDDGEQMYYKNGRAKYGRRRVFDEQGNPVMRSGLNASEYIGNKVKMSRTQDEFADVVGKKWGLERGEKRIYDHEGALKHLNETEYRAAMMVDKAQAEADVIVQDAVQRGVQLEQREETLKHKEQEQLAREAGLRERMGSLEDRERAMRMTEKAMPMNVRIGLAMDSLAKSRLLCVADSVQRCPIRVALQTAAEHIMRADVGRALNEEIESIGEREYRSYQERVDRLTEKRAQRQSSEPAQPQLMADWSRNLLEDTPLRDDTTQEDYEY